MTRFPRLTYLLAAIACTAFVFAPSCTDRHPAPNTEPPIPSHVMRQSLVDGYRHTPATADRAWTDQYLSITLQPKSYSIVSGNIHCHDGDFLSPPCMIFQVAAGSVPQTSDEAIQVVGICRGRVFDGQRRPNGSDWHIRWEGCSVKVR